MSDNHDNLKLWKQIDTTPPSATKHVSFGGRNFKSIDPQWQIKQMTKLFGPCGSGWGYEADPREVTAGVSVIAKVLVTVWYIEGDIRNEYGPVTGACELVVPRMDNKMPIYDEQLNPVMRVDTDAYKKAETDALTKALSRIGMSADVFEGRHDDTKYVSWMQETETARAYPRLETAARAAESKSQRERILKVARERVEDELITETEYNGLVAIIAEGKSQ